LEASWPAERAAAWHDLAPGGSHELVATPCQEQAAEVEAAVAAFGQHALDARAADSQ
jgi:hypothetical protein